ncbi:MAG: ATP-binding protein, partial [Gammaproteobacteria bacterium]|nr:ATP-binding protein [Gammaproteobacteria bacterium]
MASLEILAVLADEVAEAAEPLAVALGDYNAASGNEEKSEALERYREPVQRLAATAEVLELEGLRDFCAYIDANLSALDGRDLEPDLAGLLERWPALLIGYLRAPRDGVYSREIVDHCRQPGWTAPLGAVEAIGMAKALAMISASVDKGDADDRPARPETATPEDVSLVISTEVNPALVESFLAEAPLQAGAYTSLIEHINTGDANVESLNEARRLVHSIKGAANTIGLRGVAQITHHLEDLLEYLGERSISPQEHVSKLLMDAADCLEMMLESIIEGTPPPDQAQSVLQRLLDVANAIDRGEAIEATHMDGSDEKSKPSPMADAPAPAARASAPAAQAPAEVQRAIRVAARTIDEMLRLSSEMTIGRSHLQERLHEAVRLTTELRDHQHILQNRAGELDRLVTVQGVAAGQKHGEAGATGVFDALEMDQYSELHGAVHGFVETVADVQTLGTRVMDTLSSIETAINQQGLVNVELHEQIMRSRMVPAGALEPRLARTVRQACDATGRRAHLDFQGGDVMLDDHVVNDLVNPIAHLLRNAVGHGIESPEEREALGKPADGTVRISFAREGNNVVIRCEDDGAGLNLHRIYGLAVERGLITEGANLSEGEIARLILLPGFSTSESVTEVSGRGVGMDIVHNALRKLKGTVEIQTFEGKGSRFILRLPLTLGSAHCLLVRSADTLVAIPTDILDRVVYTGAKNIERLGSNWIFREDRESLDVHDLSDLLGYTVHRPFGSDDDSRPVVVVREASGKQAVVVDMLLTGRDLVIKNLGAYLG